MALYEIVRALQATDSINEKAEILNSFRDNSEFRLFLQAVYSPQISYYIKKIPVVKTHGVFSLDEAAINELVDTLATRKRTGNAAKAYLEQFMAGLDAEGQLLAGYILARDIRAGVNDSLILTAFPGLYRVPPYMRCTSMDVAALKRSKGWGKGYVQLKADGMYSAIIKHGGEVTWETRQGQVVPYSFDMGLWRTLPDGVYLGECIVSSCGEDLPRAEGNGLLTTLIKTGEISNQYDYTFLMWDFLTFDEYEAGFSNVPYCKRLLDLRENIFSSHSNLRQIVQVIKTYYIRDTQDVSEVVSKLKEFLDDGFEGAVYKKEDHIWKDGTSSDNIKLKNIFDVDLKAVSFKPGNGKNSKTFGSVVCESSCGKLVVAVSGFTDKQREHFTANPQEILGRVISVTANDITVDSSTGIFSLMNPRFNETRVFEKTIADDLVRIQTQKNSMEFLSNLLAG